MWPDTMINSHPTTSKHIIPDLQQQQILTSAFGRDIFGWLSVLQQHWCNCCTKYSSSRQSFRNNESFIYNFKGHLVNKYILCTYLQSKQCLFYNNRSGYSNGGSDGMDSIFTHIKELYKSLSALSAHSQHIIINIHKHFQKTNRELLSDWVNLMIKSFRANSDPLQPYTKQLQATRRFIKSTELFGPHI